MTENSTHTSNKEPIGSTDSSSTPADGKFDRITGQTKGLVDDVKEWVDLRVKLVQLDLEDRIEIIANQTILTLIIIMVAATSGLFGMFAAAYGLGLLFGNTAMGFLAVSATLAAATIIMYHARPRFINNALMNVARKGQSVVSEDMQLQEKSDKLALNPGTAESTETE